MKKLILFFISFLLLTSCKAHKIDNPEEAFDYVKGIKNYISDIRITFKNDRKEESVFLKQYSSSLGMYRLDLDDERTYIYKDDKILVKDLERNREYFLEENFDEVYKNCFLNEYIKLLYSMDEVDYFKETYGEGENIKVIYGSKVNLPTNNLNMKNAILYLDGDKCIPIKLEIFDSKGNVRVLVEYLTFESLEEMELSVFA